MSLGWEARQEWPIQKKSSLSNKAPNCHRSALLLFPFAVSRVRLPSLSANQSAQSATPPIARCSLCLPPLPLLAANFPRPRSPRRSLPPPTRHSLSAACPPPSPRVIPLYANDERRTTTTTCTSEERLKRSSDSVTFQKQPSSTIILVFPSNSISTAMTKAAVTASRQFR